MSLVRHSDTTRSAGTYCWGNFTTKKGLKIIGLKPFVEK